MKRVINLNIGEKQRGEVFGIAIIGMAGRFPQAGSVTDIWKIFWQAEAISFLQRQLAMNQSGVPAPRLHQDRE